MMGVYWKSDSEGGFMKNQDIGGNCLKRGGGWLGQFSRLSLKPLSGEA